jgi:hypothetical protein
MKKIALLALRITFTLTQIFFVYKILYILWSSALRPKVYNLSIEISILFTLILMLLVNSIYFYLKNKLN